MRKSLSTVYDALSQSLHTSKENPPLDLLHLCFFHEAFLPVWMVEHVCLWNWAVSAWFSGSDTKSLCLKIDEYYHKNQRKIKYLFYIFLSVGIFPLNISSFLQCDSHKWWTNWTETKPREKLSLNHQCLHWMFKGCRILHHFQWCTQKKKKKIKFLTFCSVFSDTLSPCLAN